MVARNSSFSLRGKTVDFTEVARRLGVQYVLEGSVRKAGKRVRVTIQLLDAPSGNHLWGERYDRDWASVLSSSAPISLLYPATSAARMAVSRRSTRSVPKTALPA